MSDLKIKNQISLLWIAPSLSQDLNSALNSSVFDKVIVYQSRIQLPNHSKLMVLNNARDLSEFLQSELDSIFQVQFGSGTMVGEYLPQVYTLMSPPHHLDMVGPVSVSGSLLAKVQLHIKMDQYHLSGQTSADALSQFLNTSNQGEFIVVPEIDTSVFFIKVRALAELVESGLQALLSSPNISKAIAKDILYLPSN